MTPEELKALETTLGAQTANQIKQETGALAEQFKTQLEAAQAQGASKADFEALAAKFEEAHETIVKQAEELGKMKEMSQAPQGNKLQADIKKGLTQHTDKLKGIAQTGSGVIQIKAAELIDTGNFGTGVIRGTREAGVNTYPRASRFVFDQITVMNGGPGSDPLTWINRVPKEGAAAFTAEGSAKPYLDFTYTEGKVNAEYIAVATPVSRKALVNMPMLENEINEELLASLFSKLDKTILYSGTGVSPDIQSMWGYAKTFSAGANAGQITDANIADVLRVAVGQVRKGDTTYEDATGYLPTAIVISEDMADRLDLLKTTEGAYITPYWLLQAAPQLKGVPIFSTKYIGDDEFLVGEFSRYMFNIVDGLTITVGLINDQFIKNEMMIRAELMGAGRVKLHDTFAFVKGDFETAKAALLGAGA